MRKSTQLLKATAVTLAMLMLAACGGTADTGDTAPADSGDAATDTADTGDAADAADTGDAAADTGDAAADDGDTGFGDSLYFVIPGSSGGGSDLGIRYYGQALQDEYGVTVNFENFNNTVGHQTVADAEPDGKTLTIATGALNIQYITGQADIDPMNDFTLIACLQDNGFSTLCVPADAPFDTFQEFVDYAKEHPGELNAGMPASGSNTMLFAMLQDKLGIELNPVECANEADRLTNLAGGFIDIGVVGVGNALEHEEAGNLKAIGTVASNGVTIDLYPEELPERYKTLQEQGFEDLYFNVYHYLLGPAGMDPDQVAKMNASMKHIVDVVADDIDAIGNVHGWHDLEESAQIRQQEYDDLVEIARNMGTLRPELQ